MQVESLCLEFDQNVAPSSGRIVYTNLRVESVMKAHSRYALEAPQDDSVQELLQSPCEPVKEFCELDDKSSTYGSFSSKMC